VRSTLSGIFGVAKTVTQAAASSPAANRAATEAVNGAQQQGSGPQQIGNRVRFQRVGTRRESGPRSDLSSPS